MIGAWDRWRLYGRQKTVGWTIVVLSVAYMAHFIKARLLVAGVVIESREWFYFFATFAGIMLGTMNIRLAAIRQRRLGLAPDQIEQQASQARPEQKPKSKPSRPRKARRS